MFAIDRRSPIEPSARAFYQAEQPEWKNKRAGKMIMVWIVE
jgi:hypothetical protein